MMDQANIKYCPPKMLLDKLSDFQTTATRKPNSIIFITVTKSTHQSSIFFSSFFPRWTERLDRAHSVPISLRLRIQ